MEQYAQIEAEILKYCEDNKCKWTDPKFPPDKSSLFRVTNIFLYFLFSL